MNPFDFFSGIFCISLPERNDRQLECISEFKNLGIENRIEWYPAAKFNGNHPFTGRAGCLTSHRNCIKIAKERNLDSILIFEDDVKFVNSAIDTLTKSVNFLKSNDWNIFYLGQSTTSEIVNNPLEKIDDGILRLRGGLTTHSICYHKSIYDFIIENTPEPKDTLNWLMENQAIDWWIMNKIQLNEKYKVYTTDPIICTQRPSFSNVDRKFVSYGDNLVTAFNNERSKI